MESAINSLEARLQVHLRAHFRLEHLPTLPRLQARDAAMAVVASDVANQTALALEAQVCA
jgi:hypothetical protein